MLRLRPYRNCDAQYICSWIKSEEAFRKWSADRYDRYPVTPDDINAHYAQAAQSDDFFGMTAFDETGVVGHLTMRFTDEERRILRFGFVIVDDSRRGMDYGSEMLRLALDFAFDIVKAQKVTLGVFENNEPARRCYRAVGFRDVPKDKPEYYRIMGEEWKCLEMETERAR